MPCCVSRGWPSSAGVDHKQEHRLGEMLQWSRWNSYGHLTSRKHLRLYHLHTREAILIHVLSLHRASLGCRHSVKWKRRKLSCLVCSEAKAPNRRQADQLFLQLCKASWQNTESFVSLWRCTDSLFRRSENFFCHVNFFEAHLSCTHRNIT